jgi:hypothetical protein
LIERLNTLVLDANGFGWKEHAADTALLGVLRLGDYEGIPIRLRHLPVIRGLKARYEALSYMADWRDAFCQSPELDVRVCNITNLIDFGRCLRRIRDFDLVVVLHSAAGDSMKLMGAAERWLQRRRGKLVVFLGNEYDLISEKLRFIRLSGAELVCSQLPLSTATWLYEDCGAHVVAMPHALNPGVYRPGQDVARDLDVGFIGAMYSSFIGDGERTSLIQSVASLAPRLKLTCDIRTGTVPRGEWATFLQRSRSTIGGESGTYFLDREGTLIARAKRYVEANPSAGPHEVFSVVFAQTDVECRSGKCVSSRHFEAVGTKTCQVLVDGEYNGIFESGTHYIGVRKDLSNLEDALGRLGDEVFRTEMVERTFEYVMDRHTYAHRVEDLLALVA